MAVEIMGQQLAENYSAIHERRVVEESKKDD